MLPLSFQMTMLAGAVLLLLVHISVNSFTLKAQVGNAATVGARDAMAPAAGLAGRAERALRNFNETFPAFAALVLMADSLGTSNALTQWGSALYLGFRILYLPLYLWGVPWLRTITWNIATLGIALVLVGLFV